MKKILTFLALCTVVMSVFSGCYYEDTKTPGYEYMPNMYRSPSYETYSSNPNFSDSMTARQPVAGTIARGNAICTSLDRMPYPYPNTNDGYEAAGAQLHNPLPVDSLNMAEGKRLFENYCMICHGEKGMGDGPVPEHNGPKPPAYSSDQLKNLPEGKMFHTTEFGKNMMGSHASQLTASQRWKIIMYVQTLQHMVAAAPADTAKPAAKM